MCKCVASKKCEKWPKQLAVWTVTCGSSATLGHQSLTYRPSISDWRFCEGYSEGLLYLVLTKFGSPFFCVLYVQFIQDTVNRLGKIHFFFTHWLTFATKKVILHGISSKPIIFEVEWCYHEQTYKTRTYVFQTF